jgi:transcriptional regulator GlxA family with amidase domain
MQIEIVVFDGFDEMDAVAPLEVFRTAAESVVGSVCTGAMLLAAAGLVEGRPAVTHHSAIEDLRAAGAQVVEGARFVDDGDIVTAGGVTSGLDLALHVVELVAGASIAERVALEIEYERRRVSV